MECFFVDIDGTITDKVPGRNYADKDLVLGNPIFGVMRDIMVEKGWPARKAKKAIEEYANKVIWWDYPDLIAEFNLPARKTWKRIYKWHDENLMVYEDMVELIKFIHKKGKKLFVVSNNPIVGCLLKLKRAGLGEITGSPYFRRILGANILRGQKSQPELWKKALAQVGANPGKIANIGDNPKDDAEIPLSVGIGKAFLIQRQLSQNVQITGKIIMVKSPVCISRYRNIKK